MAMPKDRKLLNCLHTGSHHKKKSAALILLEGVGREPPDLGVEMLTRVTRFCPVPDVDDDVDDAADDDATTVLMFVGVTSSEGVLTGIFLHIKTDSL